MMNAADSTPADRSAIMGGVEPDKKLRREKFHPAGSIRRLATRRNVHGKIKIVVVPSDTARRSPAFRHGKAAHDDSLLLIDDFVRMEFRVRRSGGRLRGSGFRRCRSPVS